MENIHKKNQVLKTFSKIIVLSYVFLNIFVLAYAADPTPSTITGAGTSGATTTPSTPATTATPSTPATSGTTPTFTCADVNSKGSSGFFVMLEEPIAITADANNIFCFRVCQQLTDDQIKNNTTVKQMNICKIKEKCEAETGWNNFTCQRIQVMKANSGTELVYNYVGMIYKWAAATVGIISVFTMVYGGISIMSAGGDSAKIENAKKRITQSLFGLVVLFLSGLILYTINPTFFV
jgi:hypothetical protein